MTKTYYNLPIEKFRGTKDINTLRCYPIKYYKSGASEEIAGLYKSLKQRGAKYNKIVRSKSGATQMYSYDGEAVSNRQSAVRFRDDDEASFWAL